MIKYRRLIATYLGSLLIELYNENHDLVLKEPFVCDDNIFNVIFDSSVVLEYMRSGVIDVIALINK